MKKRRRIEPSALGRRRRRRRNFRFLLWSVGVLAVLGGLIGILHLPNLKVENIDLKGNTFSSANNVLLTIKDDISGNYFGVIPKSSVFVYPKRKIESDILEKYKSIEKVTIKATNLQSIAVNVMERKLHSLWCRESNCYLMDDGGYIFSIAPDYSHDLYFVYSGLVTAANPIGQNFLPSPEFQEVNEFIENVKKLSLQPVSLRATDPQDFQLSLDSGARILFTNNQPYETTLSNLQTILDPNNPAGTRIDLSKIDYVDLRFGNKIYYK